jgi:acetyl-CoA C-acetyltransferase
MRFREHRIVLCQGLRTPIGILGKSLAEVQPEELLETVFGAVLERSGMPKEAVDGVIVGWVGEDSHAQNMARVTSMRMGLPLKTPALTLQANCVAGLEAVCAAAGRIAAGDGDVLLVGGTESMSRIPYIIRGSRANTNLRSLEALKAHWTELPSTSAVDVVDMMEEGLTDPISHINMVATAEVLAQRFGLTRAEQDQYAVESIRRSLAAMRRGFYAGHIVPVHKDGKVLLTEDETPLQRESAVTKPKLMDKAPVLFDNSVYSIRDFYRDFGRHVGKEFQEGVSKGTVTLMNACGRSDGASGMIVTTAQRAAELGLTPEAELLSWAFQGGEPAHMGLAPALAAHEALRRADLPFDRLDRIELHEPFAAANLGLFRFARETYGEDWAARHANGSLNPNGGTLALGHPIAATGGRVILNLIHALREDAGAQTGLAAACASGGIGGAVVLRKFSK